MEKYNEEDKYTRRRESTRDVKRTDVMKRAKEKLHTCFTSEFIACYSLLPIRREEQPAIQWYRITFIFGNQILYEAIHRPKPQPPCNWSYRDTTLLTRSNEELIGFDTRPSLAVVEEGERREGEEMCKCGREGEEMCKCGGKRERDV
ncbi:hypothetical protein Pcinc_036182 [Petrolisthes cinctipes]|uniref:Uncharacterized protein n=1 Tax=Petrolisthes cinctipes TaxID=88211 RepID=A0AAE1BV01_PETCI|nr:hypothetical protein Pcinc_036182 [Petrolisthes cinctipes]